MDFVQRLLALAACFILLTGCGASDTPGRRQDAVDLAQRYLDAVSGDEPDRGWSLLHPSAQEAWGTEADYVAEAEGAEWARFEVAAVEALYCDDGIICPVALNVENGEDSVPDFLRAPESRATTGIYFRTLDGIPGNAEIVVVLSDLLRGPGGVTMAGG